MWSGKTEEHQAVDTRVYIEIIYYQYLDLITLKRDKIVCKIFSCDVSAILVFSHYQVKFFIYLKHFKI